VPNNGLDQPEIADKINAVKTLTEVCAMLDEGKIPWPDDDLILNLPVIVQHDVYEKSQLLALSNLLSGESVETKVTAVKYGLIDLRMKHMKKYP
jgi:hypothetical protein